MALSFEGFEAPISAIPDMKANGHVDEVRGYTQEDIAKLTLKDDFLPLGLTEVEAWENYTNDKLYELDKMIRQWLKKTWYHRQKDGKMRTAVPILFTYLFGRPPEQKDSQTCAMMHKLLKYYCTRYTGKSTIKYQEFSRVYWFSKYSCKDRRPYSIRLRLEELDEGKDPFRVGPTERLDKSKKPRRAVFKNGKKQNGKRGKNGGHDSQGGVPDRSEDGSPTSSEPDVHGCDLQPGHQDDRADHQPDRREQPEGRPDVVDADAVRGHAERDTGDREPGRPARYSGGYGDERAVQGVVRPSRLRYISRSRQGDGRREDEKA